MAGIRFVLDHGAILGTVYRDRNGEAVAFSIHPAPSGGVWCSRTADMDRGEAWVRAIDALPMHRRPAQETVS
jgi:hypothetical protein